MSDIIVPGFQQGFAKNASEAKYPSLWDGLYALWCPSIGNQGYKLVDFSHNHINATFSGTSTFGLGLGGQSWNLNGIDSCADTNHSNGAIFENNSFSLVSSFRTSGTAAKIILAKGGNTTSPFGGFICGITSNFIVQYYQNSSSAAMLRQSFAVNDNKWHVGIANVTTNTASNSNQNIDIYIDGKLNQGTLTNTAAIGTSTENILLGKRRIGNFFLGNLGYIAIYSRHLTNSEIQLFSPKTPPQLLLRNKLFYIPFQEELGVESNTYLTGVSRITNSYDAYQTGVSRIQNSYDSYLTGLSRIQIFSDSYLTGISRIGNTYDSYLTGISRIQSTVLRPISDIDVGGWTTSPLFSKINEISPDPTNFIGSASFPLNDKCILALTQTGIPQNRLNHNIRYQIQKSENVATGINLRVALYDSNTLIASGIHTNIKNGYFITGFSLSEAEASNITSYSNLRLHFTASTGGF